MGPVTVSPGGLVSCGWSCSTYRRSRILPGTSNGTNVGILRTGSLSFTAPAASGGIEVALNGGTPGTGYDQVIVTGAVDLTNAPVLAVTLGPGVLPADGQVFVLIQNDGGDSVVGSFTGLPEGATINLGPYPFEISYVGKTGNDVVLTSLSGDLLNEAPVASPDSSMG